MKFDKSPHDVLSSNDLKTIEGIVNQHEHLRRNIRKLELYVDTSSMWNSPRTYIWKFLGQDEWKLGNGTMVTICRIHVK